MEAKAALESSQSRNVSARRDYDRSSKSMCRRQYLFSSTEVQPGEKNDTALPLKCRRGGQEATRETESPQSRKCRAARQVMKMSDLKAVEESADDSHVPERLSSNVPEAQASAPFVYPMKHLQHLQVNEEENHPVLPLCADKAHTYHLEDRGDTESTRGRYISLSCEQSGGKQEPEPLSCCIARHLSLCDPKSKGRSARQLSCTASHEGEAQTILPNSPVKVKRNCPCSCCYGHFKVSPSSEQASASCADGPRHDPDPGAVTMTPWGRLRFEVAMSTPFHQQFLGAKSDCFQQTATDQLPEKILSGFQEPTFRHYPSFHAAPITGMHLEEDKRYRGATGCFTRLHCRCEKGERSLSALTALDTLVSLSTHVREMQHEHAPANLTAAAVDCATATAASLTWNGCRHCRQHPRPTASFCTCLLGNAAPPILQPSLPLAGYDNCGLPEGAVPQNVGYPRQGRLCVSEGLNDTVSKMSMSTTKHGSIRCFRCPPDKSIAQATSRAATRDSHRKCLRKRQRFLAVKNFVQQQRCGKQTVQHLANGERLSVLISGAKKTSGTATIRRSGFLPLTEVAFNTGPSSLPRSLTVPDTLEASLVDYTRRLQITV